MILSLIYTRQSQPKTISSCRFFPLALRLPVLLLLLSIYLLGFVAVQDDQLLFSLALFLPFAKV
jgi:hypothetical protein